MKRLFLSIFGLLTVVSMCAQLPRTMEGISVGDSYTKVINKLKSAGYKYVEQKEDNLIVCYNLKIKAYNVDFNSLSIDFNTDNTVFAVALTYYERLKNSSGNNMSHQSCYSKLKQNLMEKYSKYYNSELTAASIQNHEGNPVCVFYDGDYQFTLTSETANDGVFKGIVVLYWGKREEWY